VNVWYNTAKNYILCRISSNILDRFSQYFHCMKVLYVQMTDLYLIFQLSRDVAMATKQCCRNEGKLILCAFFARLPDGSTVLVRYYLLEAPLQLRAGYTLGFAVHF